MSRFPQRGNGTGRIWCRFPVTLIGVENGRTSKSQRSAQNRDTQECPQNINGEENVEQTVSQRDTRESDALDLKRGVFKLTSAKKIATSLKRSAEQSSRRKTGAYRSALSMLTFYINRAGKDLSASRRRTLEKAKDDLRKLFH